ncbi:MAG: uncharacterized protein K0R03_1973 [Moraxellaceae bacterium]|jgi:hypothetical protein|nr:uncharacterized protein [Moraxellaceae bacterium]
MSDDHEIYSQIFFPHLRVSRQSAIDSGGRFSYYTTAETAQLILKNEELWMRNTSVMNDYMEVEHGLECLIEAFNSEVGFDLKAAMDECFPGASSELASLFNSWIPTIKSHTYIISVSEHPESEDEFGRLSMWRAYGGSAGVALVFNGGPMFRPSDALKAYSSPVAYLTREGVREEIKQISRNMRQQKIKIQNLGRSGLIGFMFEAFRFAAICTKHPAFLEEREWRVISTQFLHNSERLIPACESIGGVPQLVLKLKLEDHPAEGLFDLKISSFLDRILIGPCEHPQTIKLALSKLLSDHGIPNPGERIHITGIPLRPNQR